MSETRADYESSDRFSPRKIEQLNERSWFFDPLESQPFVALSVTSVGPSRETHLARKVLAGNMSENYGQPGASKEEWAEEANKNVNRHVKRLGYNPEHVRIMRPQQDYGEPLGMVNADDPSFAFEHDKATWLPEHGDFIYTYNPDTVLGVRPADCPIVVTKAQTPHGEMLSLTHFAWRGARAGFIEQMFDHFEELGVDLSTARMYVSPGVEPHNFPFTNEQPLEPAELFVDVDHLDSGEYKGFIDLPGFVRERLKAHGISDYQIYQDTSDTSLPESGYSSHSRATKSSGAEQNTRGILIASLTAGEPTNDAL